QPGAGRQATAEITEKISTYITTEKPHSVGTPSLLAFELQLVQLAVVAIFGQQLSVRTDLDNGAFVQHNNFAGVAHSRQPMRNDKRGTIFHEIGEGILDHLLRSTVEGRGGLV